jgi:bacteriorhodopsin
VFSIYGFICIWILWLVFFFLFGISPLIKLLDFLVEPIEPILIGLSLFLPAILPYALRRIANKRQRSSSTLQNKAHSENQFQEHHDTTRVTPATSLADELTKLANLKKEGGLSEEEFQAAKRRLLNP